MIPQTELLNNTRSIVLSEPQVNSQMDNYVSDLTLPSDSQIMDYTTSPTHQIVPQRQHNNNIRSSRSSLNTSTLPSTENKNENFNSSVSTYRKYDVRLPFATGLPEHVTFICTICQTNFNSKKSLQRHIENIHDTFSQG